MMIWNQLDTMGVEFDLLHVGQFLCAAIEYLFSIICFFSPINRNLRFTPTFPMIKLLNVNRACELAEGNRENNL